MVESFLISIFPPGGLANSVTTTVWVGVCVTCFFNLRFGWVLSGLVVPGYLVPLLIGKPFSAGVIVVEAVITYLLVWFLSEVLSRFRLWSGFFGRDRFFALLLVSILVRVVLDTMMLPWLGEYLLNTFQLHFDYRNNLHSFGLVVVALLANQFWKSGLRGGILPVFITVSVTYLVVRHIIMPFTNFNMGDILYMYEDIASSMLASPKAYIILLTTAVIASRMNMHYGWDYNGILIPSLLALQWYQPIKLFVTFAETFIILGAAALIVRAPFFRNANLEGARKILLFFNIGFAYKLLLGWLVIWFWPELKVADIYGFGYLLTTLLAIKMYDKEIAVRMTVATVKTSFAAVMIASVAGFALTHVPNPMQRKAEAIAVLPATPRDFTNVRLVEALGADKVNLYGSLRHNAFVPPLPRELDLFAAALKKLLAYLESGDEQDFATTRQLLAAIGYRLAIVENRYLYLYEPDNLQGWGTYVIDRQAASRLLITIPAPMDEWNTLEAGAALFLSTGARALALAGTARRTNEDGASDVLNNHATIFNTFQRLVGRKNVLQIRGELNEEMGDALTVGSTEESSPPAAPPSILRTSSSLPADLDLAVLHRCLGELSVQRESENLANVLRDSMGQGGAELVLNRQDARRLVSGPSFRGSLPVRALQGNNIAGYLHKWRWEDESRFAAKGSDQYVRPTIAELLYFEHEILVPLFAVARRSYVDGTWTGEGLRELDVLGNAAAAMGYEIIRFHEKKQKQDYLILTEGENVGRRRYWGAYVFRLGESSQYLLQAPQMLAEINVYEYTVSLFEQLNAAALMIGTAHPLANVDGTADVTRLQNRRSLFSLFNQVFLRGLGDVPFMVVQCQARRMRIDEPASTADILLAKRSGVPLFRHTEALFDQLTGHFQSEGLTMQVVDGSQETAGYEVSGSAQAMYLDHTDNKDFVGIWLNQSLRAHFRQQSENIAQARQFDALGIPTVEEDLNRYIGSADPSTGSDLVDQKLQRAVETYVQTADIVALNRITAGWPHLQYSRLIDTQSGQSYLCLRSQAGETLMLANLFPKNLKSTARLEQPGDIRERLADYADSRAAWLGRVP